MEKNQSTPPPGYHLCTIKPGVLGELSKIEEELDELKDAASQGSKVLELVELADLFGAIELYLEKHHPGTSMDDLRVFAAITKRAFQSGQRPSK